MMMTTKKKTRHGRATLSALAGITMVASMAAAPALASEPVADEAKAAGNEAQAKITTVEGAQVKPAQVEGAFAFDQATLTSNEEIKAFFQRATRALCGATAPLVADNPLGWKLAVSGDVEAAFTADVTGIPVEHLLARAGAAPGANAVTFVSADGTRQAFPLGYVVGRHAVLSYEINDEDLSASVGGNNQLWMMKTPANYFVRDVVEIVVATEEVAPPVPGEGDEHPNSPNAGVLAGSQG